MDRPLRLISANPLDQLARVVEALLVVASAPLSVADLAAAAEEDEERVETALRLLRERYRDGRSGIVLEHVAGGWAFRAAREAAAACSRLFERPVEKGLSQAALETLAIVAYLGPCTRPDIARVRGVAADGVVVSGGRELRERQRLRRDDEQCLERARELVERVRRDQAERTFHASPLSRQGGASLVTRIGANGVACSSPTSR